MLYIISSSGGPILISEIGVIGLMLFILQASISDFLIESDESIKVPSKSNIRCFNFKIFSFNLLVINKLD